VVAVAVPYVLDATNPPTRSTIASRPQSTPSPPPPTVTPTPAPATATATSSPLSAQADKALDAAVPAPRKLGADTATLADKPPAGARATVGDKPVADKPAAIAQIDDKPSEKPFSKNDAKVVAAASDVKPKRIAARSTTTTASAPRPAATSEWWVQIGAYREESTARKVAARLREQNYAVEESVRGGDKPVKASVSDQSPAAASTPNPVVVDQYDVFVSGTTADALSSRLSGKSLTAEPSGTGVIVKPSLPLRDAVALSKDLATEGLKVQVRRAGTTGETTIPAADKRRVQAPSISDPLYRVRVGSFADRETAVATLKELESKGYKPFIARGGS
jgi:hypothetical protein